MHSFMKPTSSVDQVTVYIDVQCILDQVLDRLYVATLAGVQ